MIVDPSRNAQLKAFPDLLANVGHRPIVATSATLAGVTYHVALYPDNPSVLRLADRAGGVNIYRRPDRSHVALTWATTD